MKPRKANSNLAGPTGMASPKAHPTLVSDHAFVRYLEITTQLDVERAKREILADGREQVVASISEGRIKIHEKNLLLIIRNGVVVSIHKINERRAV